MNQIICNSSSNIELLNENQENSINKLPKVTTIFSYNITSKFSHIARKRLFKIFFYILTFISFSLTLYYAYFRYDLYKYEKISKDLLDNFNITNLYPNSDYTANFVSKDIFLNNSEIYSSSVIGVIEIKKINIVYPILSEINKDFLKISPCRFYGPYPNEIGNLCIAAHNYKNDKFFSKISNLLNGDIITIYDIYENSIDYVVYDVYTANANATECMNQNTNNSRVVTLVTCDSLNNSYRTIVKAKEL